MRCKAIYESYVQFEKHTVENGANWIHGQFDEEYCDDEGRNCGNHTTRDFMNSMWKYQQKFYGTVRHMDGSFTDYNSLKVMYQNGSRLPEKDIDDLSSCDENEVVPEASFTNDLGADSLDTVELIMEFEKEFDIQIPDDQAENIITVGQAIEFIEKSD